MILTAILTFSSLAAVPQEPGRFRRPAPPPRAEAPMRSVPRARERDRQRLQRGRRPALRQALRRRAMRVPRFDRRMLRRSWQARAFFRRHPEAWRRLQQHRRDQVRRQLERRRAAPRPFAGRERAAPAPRQPAARDRDRAPREAPRDGPRRRRRADPDREDAVLF